MGSSSLPVDERFPLYILACFLRLENESLETKFASRLRHSHPLGLPGTPSGTRSLRKNRVPIDYNKQPLLLLLAIESPPSPLSLSPPLAPPRKCAVVIQSSSPPEWRRRRLIFFLLSSQHPAQILPRRLTYPPPITLSPSKKLLVVMDRFYWSHSPPTSVKFFKRAICFLKRLKGATTLLPAR